MNASRLVRKQKVQKTNPYAHIDWEKAAGLFKNPLSPLQTNKNLPPVRDILRVLAAAGAVGLMFAFPGAAVGIAALFPDERNYSRWGTRRTINRLVRQKYVTVVENSDGSTTLKITEDGMLRALTYQLDTLQLKKPKNWDGKWRVIIFDVPEKHRRLRDIFRTRLGQLGLYQLQESVYVSPYACFKEIEFLRELYSVSFNVRYLLVEKIEDDASLRNHFELKT